MKRIVLIALVVVVARGIASAQTADVLGPHVNYHRGCRACHTPHSSAPQRDSARTPNPCAGAVLLWGEDVSALAASPEQKYVFLPPTGAPTPEQTGKLICLSCHDGNYAPAAMMKNEIYETVPERYGSSHHVPTLADKASVSTGNDFSGHPVGLDARLSCGGTRDWDCTESQDGTINMGGRHSSGFAGHYGYFVRPRNYRKTSIVVCTTCHNPHLVNVVHISKNSESALFPAGTYATRYFLRAPYDPIASPDAGNQAAQFCRQCHADKSNEMNGSPAGSVLH